ncbi:hypothetical protein K3X13_15390 (plasmid) [Aliiroseovarius crassostreae]|nr:hypothetical protein K3X13_15390 [Aliiroseovarius crassostreae]
MRRGPRRIIYCRPSGRRAAHKTGEHSMTVLDRRMNRRNIVLNYGQGDEEQSRARLIVDQTHPFFFDHPLDHVPGLLLLEGAVQAAQNSATFPCFVAAIRAQFVKYAYFERPIHVTWKNPDEDKGQQRCHVEIMQDHTLCARITVDLRPETGLVRAGQLSGQPGASGLENGGMCKASVGRDAACDGGTLNKLRAENVLITTPHLGTEHVTAQLLPMADTCLFGDGFDVVHPLYLLEAFMQVQRYLNATQDGDKRIRDILTGVSIDLSRPLASLTNVTLHGTRVFQNDNRGRLWRGATLQADGQAFAQCSIETARLTRARKSRTSKRD